MVIYLYEKLDTILHDVIIFARSMFYDKINTILKYF